ncbi:unnamed protein product [Sphagnum balticum]
MQLKHERMKLPTTNCNNRLTDSSTTAGNNKTSKLITQQRANGPIYGFPNLDAKSTYNKRVEEKKSRKVC